MGKVLLAFESESTLQKMEQVFVNTGIRIEGRARSCAETLRLLDRMSDGVVLCGFKLLDGDCESMYYDFPHDVHMLMLAPMGQLEHCETEGIMKLPAPVRRSDLLETIQMMLNHADDKHISAPRRSDEEKAIINQAKALLMDRNGMSEQQAHRYIQKRSMDAGAKMVQTAKLILGDSEFHL